MSIKVEFGFSSTGEPVDFSDISADVIAVSTNRGKDPQQDTFNAATCSIQLNNETRNYDPDYGPSPYQGKIVPTVRLGFTLTSRLSLLVLLLTGTLVIPPLVNLSRRLSPLMLSGI